MTELGQSFAAHDHAIAASGSIIWLGAEPTFTDPTASSKEWETAALGSDKESRARRFVRRLSKSCPDGILLPLRFEPTIEVAG